MVVEKDRQDQLDRSVKNQVLRKVKERRNILHTIRSRKANWIGHILRRNCLLKHVIGGKIDGTTHVTGRRGIRRKRVLDDVRMTRQNAGH